jgi:hypothetical protein
LIDNAHYILQFAWQRRSLTANSTATRPNRTLQAFARRAAAGFDNSTSRHRIELMPCFRSERLLEICSDFTGIDKLIQGRRIIRGRFKKNRDTCGAALPVASVTSVAISHLRNIVAALIAISNISLAGISLISEN